MTDLSDINMEGVKPMSETQELPVGQYLIRVEDTEKKETKEKFDEEGKRLPSNHYLQISMKVYGGPNDGQVEFARLNLWNVNQTAVNMAKSELKSIQDATGVMSSNSDHFHGKWAILEIKAGIKDPTKLYKSYHPAPADLVAQFSDVPPVPAKAPSVAAAPPAAATPPAYLHNAPGAAAVAAAPAAPVGKGPNDLPSWASKKA